MEKFTECPALVVNTPEFFADPEFVAWLNNGSAKFTWHQGGEPGEYSDVIVSIDPGLSGEGSDSDMPEHIWNQIVEAVKQYYASRRVPGLSRGNHILVRLTNLDN